MCFIWPTTFSSSSSSSPSSLSLSFSQRFSDGPASTATGSSPKFDCPSLTWSSVTRMLCACSFSLLALFSSSLTLLSRYVYFPHTTMVALQRETWERADTKKTPLPEVIVLLVSDHSCMWWVAGNVESYSEYRR